MTAPISPIALFVDSLRHHLAAELAAQNRDGQPIMYSKKGDFTITSGMQLRVSHQRDDPTTVDAISLTQGTRTAAQIAADITNGQSLSRISATSDTDNRVKLTCDDAVSSTAPSLVVVCEDTGTVIGANTALGWSPGGEYVYRANITAPGIRGICDGWPATAPDMGAGFWVIIDDRRAVPYQGSSMRSFVWQVDIKLRIAAPVMVHSENRTRESISWCVGMVAEILDRATGRYLGAATAGVVQNVQVTEMEISGRPLRFQDAPNQLYDVANMGVRALVYQVPSQ